MFRKKIKKAEKKQEIILLDKKIDEFINWYNINMVKGKYTDIGEYLEPKKMRYLIDRMTSWFELRYPEIEINDKLIETNTLNDDFKDYLKKLSWEEKWMFYSHGYQDIVYIDKPKGLLYLHTHFHLNSKGFVIIADEIEALNTYGIHLKGEDFVGKHIEEVYQILKDLNLSLDLREIDDAINNYKKFKKLKEEFLNCVMYNIIERGGNRIGPRRGLIFAREFKRDISVPMKYGVDLSDPNLREFMDVYFRLGGSKDLECIKEYFLRNCDDYKFDTINLKELTRKINNTEEENKLVQGFVSQIQVKNHNKVKKLVK